MPSGVLVAKLSASSSANQLSLTREKETQDSDLMGQPMQELLIFFVATPYACAL